MAVTKSGKLQFTDEQYKIARYDSSALEYARSRNYDLVKMGGHYSLKEHDSMIFTPDGRWFWNSRGIQGGALEFMMHYEYMTLPTAVLTLAGERSQEHAPTTYKPRQSDIDASKKAVPFVAPPRGNGYKQMYAYLLKTRGINNLLLSQLVKDGLIYPTTFKSLDNKTELTNVVFIGKDADGIARSAFARGCTNFSTFKMETEGSDKTVPFTLRGNANSTKLCVFEGAIDAISHASIEMNSGSDWRDCHRLSQGGNAPIETITKFLTANPQVDTVDLCMDNDDAGRILSRLTGEKLTAAGFGHLKITTTLPPKGKDWNDFLLTQQTPNTEPNKKPRNPVNTPPTSNREINPFAPQRQPNPPPAEYEMEP